MTKKELWERLDRRSRERYGIPFTEAFLDDLIKDKLIRSRRLANNSKTPVHYFGRGAYRRGLQVTRMKATGILRRDTQRVFLFLKGYSFQTSAVRKPLRREYVRHGKELLSQIRSRYISDNRDIPPGQKARLLRNLGPPDAAFTKAGISLDDEFLIAVARSAMQQPLNMQATSELSSLSKLAPENQLAALAKLLDGMLLLDEEPGTPVDQELDNIESLILNTTEDVYEMAREIFCKLDFSHPLVAKMLAPNVSAVEFKPAANAVRLAISYDPRFATAAFASLLRVVTHKTR